MITQAELVFATRFENAKYKSLGAVKESAISQIIDLGHKISLNLNEPRKSICLFWHLSVAFQRCDSTLPKIEFR